VQGAKRPYRGLGCPQKFPFTLAACDGERERSISRDTLPQKEKDLKSRSTRGILERLKNGVVQGAEGYVFELERRGYIKAGPYVPEVVLDFPEAVKELHREFLRAGCEVMVALTYYAHREKLKDVGRENDLELMNRQAVRLANEIAREGDALVAGNICNTWAYDPHNVKESSRIVRTMYEEQLAWAAEEGIDFVISETNDYLGEALIALEVIKQLKLPAMVTLASVQQSLTRDGYDYVEACKILADHGADIVGLNCDRGPETMLPIIENLRSAISCYVAAQPVPYKTNTQYPTFESLRTSSGEQAFPLLLEPFLCNRFEMAEFARKAQTIGVNYVGICCGGAPHYVRAMAEALGRIVPASKYSPAMELHPVLGAQIEEKHKEFLVDWKS
jgi:betaine-homocysteine S-methyltransferase